MQLRQGLVCARWFILFGLFVAQFGCMSEVSQPPSLPNVQKHFDGTVLDGRVAQGVVRLYAVDAYGQINWEQSLHEASISQEGHYQLPPISNPETQVYVLRAEGFSEPLNHLKLHAVVSSSSETPTSSEMNYPIDFQTDWALRLAQHDVIPDCIASTEIVPESLASCVVESLLTQGRVEQAKEHLNQLILGNDGEPKTLWNDVGLRKAINASWLHFAAQREVNIEAFWKTQWQQSLQRVAQDSAGTAYFFGQLPIRSEENTHVSLSALLNEAYQQATLSGDTSTAKAFKQSLPRLSQMTNAISDVQVSTKGGQGVCQQGHCKQASMDLLQRSMDWDKKWREGDFTFLEPQALIAPVSNHIEQLKRLQESSIPLQRLWNKALVQWAQALLQRIHDEPQSLPASSRWEAFSRDTQRFNWVWEAEGNRIDIQGAYDALTDDPNQFRIRLTAPLTFQSPTLSWFSEEVPLDQTGVEVEPGVEPVEDKHFGDAVIVGGEESASSTRNTVQYFALSLPTFALMNGENKRLLEGSMQYGLQRVVTKEGDSAYNFDDIQAAMKLFPETLSWTVNISAIAQRSSTFKPQYAFPALGIHWSGLSPLGFLQPNPLQQAPDTWRDLVQYQFFNKVELSIPTDLQPLLEDSPLTSAARLSDPSGADWFFLYESGDYQSCSMRPKWICSAPIPVGELRCEDQPVAITDTGNITLIHALNALYDQGCLSQVYIPGQGVYLLQGERPIFSESSRSYSAMKLHSDSLGLSKWYLQSKFEKEPWAWGVLWHLQAPIPGYRVETLASGSGQLDSQLYLPTPFGSDQNYHWHRRWDNGVERSERFIKSDQEALQWVVRPDNKGTFLLKQGKLIGRYIDHETSVEGSHEVSRSRMKGVIFIDRSWALGAVFPTGAMSQ